MNIKDRIEMINEVTIKVVKFQVEQELLNRYFDDGGDPRDLSKQNGSSGLPAENGLPF